MVFIRTLHPGKYDINSRRFPSDCFKRHGKGISVFVEECAKEVSNNSICLHIINYYSAIVGTPIVFCRINFDHLSAANGFDKMKIEETPSFSGDICHRDISNVTNGQSGNYAKNFFRPPNIYMCCNGVEKQITLEEYEDLLNNLC